jgi:hypothetical protein
LTSRHLAGGTSTERRKARLKAASHARRELAYADIGFAKEASRQMHSPACQILHGRHADELDETPGKHRT